MRVSSGSWALAFNRWDTANYSGFIAYSQEKHDRNLHFFTRGTVSPAPTVKFRSSLFHHRSQCGDGSGQVGLDFESRRHGAVVANETGDAKHFVYVGLEIAQYHSASMRSYLAQQAQQGPKAGAGQIGYRLKIDDDVLGTNDSPRFQELVTQGVGEVIADYLRQFNAENHYGAGDVLERLICHEAPWPMTTQSHYAMSLTHCGVEHNEENGRE
jgi:hypothetical protein